eukprot:3878712-Pyramimonas_sp.AAC.1
MAETQVTCLRIPWTLGRGCKRHQPMSRKRKYSEWVGWWQGTRVECLWQPVGEKRYEALKP